MARKNERKNSFVIYEDWMNIVLSLPDAEAIDFVRAIFSYCLQKDYDAGPVANGLLQTVIPKLEADIGAYAEKREKAKQSILARWNKGKKPPDTDEYERIPTNTDEIHVYVDVDVDDDVDVYDVLTDNKGAKAPIRSTLSKIIDQWNSFTDRGDIPMVKSVSPESKNGRSIMARVRQYGIETVMDVIGKVFESDFLRGKDGKWCARFDWVFLPNNFEKILNGNYGTGNNGNEEGRGSWNEAMELRRINDSAKRKLM